MNRARPAGADITSRAGCPASSQTAPGAVACLEEGSRPGVGVGSLTSFNPAVDSLTANPAAPGAGRGAAAGRAQKCPDEASAALDKPRGVRWPPRFPQGVDAPPTSPQPPQVVERPSDPPGEASWPLGPLPLVTTGLCPSFPAQESEQVRVIQTTCFPEPMSGHNPAHLPTLSRSPPQAGGPSPATVHTNLQPLAPRV